MISLNPGDKLRTPDDDLKAGDLLSTFKQKLSSGTKLFLQFQRWQFGHAFLLLSFFKVTLSLNMSYMKYLPRYNNKLHADKNELK